MERGEVVQVLKGHENWIWAQQFDGKLIASGSDDHTVRVWNPLTAKCYAVLTGIALDILKE